MRTLALTTLLAGAAAIAQPGQPGRGPRPTWAIASEPLPVPANVGGPVFVRRQDTVIHLDAKAPTQFLDYRVKILQSNALQLGNLAVSWNPAAGTPIVHEITVYRDGQANDVLKSASFEVLRREDQLEAAHLDGVLTAVLRVPDLRVGDELEVAVTTPVGDPTLGASTAGVLALGPGPAPGRYRLGLSWENDAKPNLKMSADMTAAAHPGTNAVDFRLDNPEPLTPPKDAPPRYRWQRVVEYSSFADWPAVARRFAPLYVGAAGLGADSPVRREATRIAAANPKPFDRAAAALKLVQQDVRYIYVGLNGGNLRPAAADETWQRRYGDCKAKTALLLALLKELGIPAEPVLVNASGADDGFDQRLPSPGLFDHVLVRATIDGASYWLDGTLPPIVPPAASPLLPFRWVLPLSPGSGLEGLPSRPAITPDNVNLFEIDARAGFDKPARITTTTIVRGVKGVAEQVQFSQYSAAQLLATFRQNAVGDVWQTIDSVDWHYDSKATASVLTITGTGTVHWEDDSLGARSLALAGGGFSPPEQRVRGAGQDATAPFYSQPDYSCHVTTVRLPTGTRPTQWSSKPSYDGQWFGRHYRRAFELRDGAIRMVRASRIEQAEIEAATAARDNARIGAFDNSMGYIFYNPLAQRQAVGNGEHVPATYDLDWTATAVPCIAPLAAK